MTLPPLRDVIARYGLNARKSLGQHFLLDGNITDKIVDISGDLSGVHVIEVGPGPGGLTRSILASNAASITAIEKDDRCIAALAELQDVYGDRLKVIAQDALTWSALLHVPEPRAIIANLPYNVGTVLLINWLDEIAQSGPESYRSLTLMFQKEVADRLLASPHSKAYGRLSVMVQWLCTIEHGFDLSPQAFTPPPKVASSVIRLVPRGTPLYPASKTQLEKVLAAAFGQRRKMLRGSLSMLSANAETLLTQAGIDPTRRAETLSVEEFCRLATVFSEAS